MKKLKNLWLRIPRPQRAVMNILAIALLAFWVYALLGAPAFTTHQKFRRAEKANLVGPARILAEVDIQALGYDRMILAESDDAITLFQCSGSPWEPGRLTYREKTGPVTVMTVPHIGYHHYTAQVIDLPVFVCHEYPDAVRAELDLEFGEGMARYTEVNWSYDGLSFTTTYEKTWRLESTADLGGCFRFDIHAEPEGETIQDSDFEVWHPFTSEGEALEVFSHMMEVGDRYPYAAIPAAVRLYDRDDALIAEEFLTIRSIAGDNYARKEGIS